MNRVIETGVDTEGIEILKKEVPSKIFLTLLIYKEGKDENGENISAFKIAKILYGEDAYTILAHINREVNNLYKAGLITKEETIIKRNKRIFTLKPNLDKFVDLFIEYFNLNFTEEEKQIFKEWFKEINWMSLVLPYDIQEYLKLGTIRNIFEWVGANLKPVSKMILRIEKTPKKDELIKYIKEYYKESAFEFFYEYFLHFYNLPKDIIKKLANITLPSNIEKIIDISTILGLMEYLIFITPSITKEVKKH